MSSDVWSISGEYYDVNGFHLSGFNLPTSGYQVSSNITALSDGGFVVSGESFNQEGLSDGLSIEISGEYYDANGFYISGFNLPTWDYKEVSSHITALSDGGFVVTVTSKDQPYSDPIDSMSSGQGNNISVQYYDSAGEAVGSEFNFSPWGYQVNATTTALSDGGFIVTWESFNQEGLSEGVFGQRYDSAGQAVMAEPAVIGVQSLDFNDLNLIAGDSLTLNIEGGNSLEAVLGSEGLDQALENLASSLATYSDLFSAVSAEQGVLTFQGLTDGSAVAEVSVAITPTTDLGLETVVIDSNENNDAVIDFQATGGSVTLEGVEMANLTAAHFQLHDLSSVV